MTVLWISFAALYALGMLWLAYQIRTAPSDLDLSLIHISEPTRH